MTAPDREQASVSHSRVRVAHQIPGRTRLRIDRAQRSRELLGQLETTLRAVPGMQQVESHGVTGSILLTYDRDLTAPDDIAAALEGVESLVLDLVPPRLRAQARGEISETAQSVASAFQALNVRVAAATDGWVDLKMLIPAALLGGAVIGATLTEGGLSGIPPYVLAYYAFDTYMKFHYQTAPAGRAPAYAAR